MSLRSLNDNMVTDDGTVTVDPDDFVDDAIEVSHDDVSDGDGPTLSRGDERPEEPQKEWYTGGLPQSAAALTPPTTVSPQSALGYMLPSAYGPNKATGALYALRETDTRVYCLWVLCHGEQAGQPTDIELGGKPITEWQGSGVGKFLVSHETREGSASQTQSSILQTIYAGSLVSTTTLPGYCYVAASFNRASQHPMPGDLTITAVVPGKVITDPRDSSTGAFTNAMLVAHDIMTDRLRYPGFNNIGRSVVGRWGSSDYEWIMNRCDEVMSDSSARFQFNGLIETRDIRAALREVLGHCFCRWYVEGSQIRIFPDLLPEAVTGTWSAVASSTLSSSRLLANPAVGVGDGLLFEDGTAARIVGLYYSTQIKELHLDREVTITGEVIRAISGAHIHQDESERGWIKGPDMMDEDPASTPDVVVVNYREEEGFGSVPKRAEDPDGYTPNEVIRTEASYSGINNASNAVRVGHQLRRTPKLCPFTWTGTAGQDAAGLVPGDILTFDSNVLTDQLAIVISAKALPGNTYAVTLREFDVGIYSDDVADDDELPDGTPPPTTFVAPTAVEQRFVYSGGLDAYNELDDHSDLTATGANFIESNCSLSHVGSEYTRMTASGAIGFATSSNLTWPDYSSQIPDRSVLNFLWRMDPAATYDSGVTVGVIYYRHVTGGITLNMKQDITPKDASDTGWNMLNAAFDHDGGVFDYTMVDFKISGDPGGGMPMNFKRVYVLPGTTNPRISIGQRWLWAEDGDSDVTTDRYQIRHYVGAGSSGLGNIADGASVPEGSSSLDIMVFGGFWGAVQEFMKLAWEMLAISKGGQEAEMPATTQSVVSVGGTLDVVDDFKDFDDSSISAGKVVVVGVDGETKEYQTPAELGITLSVVNMTTGSYVGSTYQQHIRYDVSGGSQPTVVPTAVGHIGEELTYKRVDDSGNSLTLTFNGAEKGDGHTSILMLSRTSLTFISNGTDWDIK